MMRGFCVTEACHKKLSGTQIAVFSHPFFGKFLLGEPYRSKGLL